MKNIASIIVCILSGVQSYPNYVPSSRCLSMFPGHEVDAMNADTATSTPPYILTVNATTYEPGDVIEIFLNSSQSGSEEFALYGGVFVQARRADCNHAMYTEAVGTFILKDNEDFLETSGCKMQPNKAVRHGKNADVYNSSFYWIAPSTSVGHIYFRGTIAKTKTIFWTNVNSEYIQDSKSSSSLPSSYCQPETKYVEPRCPSPNNTPTDTAVTTTPFKFCLLINLLITVHYIA